MTRQKQRASRLVPDVHDQSRLAERASENRAARWSSRRSGLHRWAVGIGAVAVTLWAASAAYPAGPGQDGEEVVVVKTKKAITITGEEIADAVIVIKNGKIDAVGSNVTYPSESRIIDARHLVAMPGLIDPRSRIGLPSVPRSGNRSHLRLADQYYPPDDETYRKLLEAGYTMLGLYCDGTGLPGQGLVVCTPGAKPKEGLKPDGLVRMVMTQPVRDKAVLIEALKAAQAEIDKEKQAATRPAGGGPPTQTGPSASGPGAHPATQPSVGPATQPTTTAASGPASAPAPSVKPELVPLIALLKKTDGFQALVEFSRASDVIHFEDAAGKFDFARAYLFTDAVAPDLHQVVQHKLLGGADALVAMSPNLRNMPLTVNRYDPPKQFVDAGCRVVFVPVADTVEEHERIRERLASLVRAGLSRNDALKGVTLHAAMMLTLDKQFGSIEKGKRADLIFLDGDPLDPFAKVRRVMVNGEMVLDLDRTESMTK